MRLSGVAVVLLAALLLLAGPAVAQTSRCYVFRNRTAHPVTLKFSYNVPVGEGTVTSMQLFPNSQPWRYCIDAWPQAWVATVLVEGGGVPSWSGALQLASGGPVSAPGEYFVDEPPPAPVPPPSARRQCSTTCGVINPSSCKVECPVGQHAGCYCDCFVACWERCKCFPGP